MKKTISTLMALLGIASAAWAQGQQRFTIHHEIQFAPGTESVRKVLVAAGLRDLAMGAFSLALEDLNDDGTKEWIIVGADSMWCGSGGCAAWVLEMRQGKLATILDHHVFPSLAVTNEKVGGYRALAALDMKGAIAAGDRPGTPAFGQQLVYPMSVPAPAAVAPPSPAPVPPPTAAPSLCVGRPLCTENLQFAATIADFRAILENTTTKTLLVRMTFTNKLDRPLALGYVRGSGVATDDRGNRYEPAGERAIQGIGQVWGGTADAKFVLQPGESSDARFEFVWRTSGQEIFGLAFDLDLAIREIAQLPGNQLQLGREYALHFTRLAHATTAAGGQAPPAVSPAAVPAGDVAVPRREPRADGCAGKPRGACAAAGPFAAEIVALTPSFAMYNLVHLLKARVRFRNLTGQPIVLGFVAGSAVIVDNYGGRYTMDQRGSGEGAAGIGLVQRSSADPQFTLAADASGEATFTLSRRRNDDKTDAMGTAFGFDLSIADLQVLPSRQVRTNREYTIGFTGLRISSGATAPAPAPPDGCPPAKRQSYCAGPFSAEVMSTNVSATPGGDHIVQLRVRFRNLTDRPLTLGYMADSAVFVDNYGGRYAVVRHYTGDGVAGLGIVRGTQADPRFVLRGRATGDATFTLSRHRNVDRTDPVGSTFDTDMTIAELEVLPSRQIRVVREYPVSFPGVTASGGLLEKILQAMPKKGGGR